MASQGLLWNVNYDGRNFNFKSVSFRETSSSIDRTSKFNRDGSVNVGFTDTAGDCGTLFVTVDEIIEDTGIIGDLAYFHAGAEAIGIPITISYDGVTIYAMQSFYVDDVESSGSIPGEARVRFAFHSIGPYSPSA